MLKIGLNKHLDKLLDGKISSIHTAYLAKVLSVSKNNTAKIQPLGLCQNQDGTTYKQSVLSDVPVANHVWHITLVKQDLAVTVRDTYSGGGSATITPNPHPVEENVGHVKIEPIKAGDIVICICCERNISEAKRGVNALPPAGQFSYSDSIIIGLL